MLQIEIDEEIFNSVYLPYLDSQNRYEVFYGGAGSGKSHFVAQKKIYQHLSSPGRKTLVVRKVAKTIRHSVYALLKQVIFDWELDKLFKINKSDMEITCANGNTIIFAGLDDVEKLKSITGITDIWIEEGSEVTQEDFQQLDLRLRGPTRVPKQITLTFNPVSITHWLKGYFFDKPLSNCTVLKTTYKDNKYVGDEYEAVLMELKEKDPYYYAVYALGEWGVLGKTIFPAQIVSERIAQLREIDPIKRGFFAFDYKNDRIIESSITWVDADDGYITIYQEPKKYYPYVIGGDTAGDGSDNFTGQVLDNTDGSQVAVLMHQFDEDLYARQMYCLGKHYNWAMAGIETNFSTFPVKELTRMQYPKQFMRQHEDTFTGKIEYRYGFQTNKLTRPIIIADLVKTVRENPELFRDIATLEEMLTFVRSEKGKPEAMEGKHDDLIMALAIANYIRPQHDIVPVVPKPEKKKLPYPFDNETKESDWPTW